MGSVQINRQLIKKGLKERDSEIPINKTHIYLSNNVNSTFGAVTRISRKKEPQNLEPPSELRLVLNEAVQKDSLTIFHLLTYS